MKLIRSAVVVSMALLLLLPAHSASAVVSQRPQTSASFNGTVRALAVKGSVVYVGGDFTSATDSSGTYSRNRLAAVNAKTGKVLPWNPSANNTVYALAVYKNRVFAGGRFSKAGGRTVTRLARISTTSARADRGYRPKVSGVVRALAVNASRLYLGGDFLKVKGKDRTRLAALSRKTGALSSWSPRANDRVMSLRVTKRLVYLGGYFRAVNGKTRGARISALSVRTGALSKAFDPQVDYPVLDMAVAKRRLYLAGAGVGGRLEAVSRSNGGRVWRRAFDGDVQSVEVYGRVVYAGGHFDSMCASVNTTPPNGDCVGNKVISRRLAAFKPGGKRLAGWVPAADSNEGVRSIRAVRGVGKLAVGGAFDRFGSGTVSQPKFALFRK